MCRGLNSPKVILLAKSEIRAIHVWQAVENLVGQRAGRREHDFASSITFGEVERAGASMRNMEKRLPRNDAVFLILSATGARGKTSKPPCFTKCGQEPEHVHIRGHHPRTLPWGGAFLPATAA
jgi:hypothetical protein